MKAEIDKIPQLTSNGFVKTSSSDGTLTIDTSTYLTAESDTLQTVTTRGATSTNPISVDGTLTNLTGTGVSNLVVGINTSGTTIPPLSTYSVRWTAKVTAYKTVGVENYFYDTVTSASNTAPALTSYDVSITWDALAGATGYMVQIEVYLVEIAFTYQSFTIAYRPVTTNSYTPLSSRPYLSSDSASWIQLSLDASDKDYYGTAFTTKGAINLTQNGIINSSGTPLVGKKGTTNYFVGSNTLNGTESYVFGESNNVGLYFQAGGIVFGKSNTVTTGTVVGKSNTVGTGTVIGNSNTVTTGTVIGSSNVSNFDGDLIVGSSVATIEQSAIIGTGSALGSINKTFGINLTSNNFVTFAQKASYGVELNKSTIVEDISKDVGFSLYKNSLMANAGTDWILGAAWRKTSFVRYEKYQDGTSTLTPSSNPIEAGKRYLVQIRFDSSAYATPFTGAVTVTAGGVTIGTYSKDGSYSSTFTAINTNTLTFTPTNTSRFGVYGVYLEEIKAGDLTVLGDINIGNAYKINTDGEATLNSLSLSSATRGLEKIRNGSFIATGTSTGVSLLGWTLASGWTYDNTNSTVLKSANGTGTLTQPIASMYSEFVVGKTYELIYTISGWSVGTVTPTVAGVTLTARSADGTYTEQFTALSNTALAFTPSNTARFTIDNISIKRVLLSRLDVTGNITGTNIIRTGGVSTEFLKADGSVDSSTYLTSTLQVFNEVPTGAIDSANTVYTTANNFVTNSTQVYLNKLRQVLGTDYTETGANQITFTTAPDTGDSLIIDYQQV